MAGSRGSICALQYGRSSRHDVSPLFSSRHTSKLPRVRFPTLSLRLSKATVRQTLTVHGRLFTKLRAEPELDEQPLEFKSEEELKKERSDELRKAETFMIVGEGNATCSVCQYNYEFAKGDPDFPIAPGTRFQDLPDDYRCPLCGAPKEKFRSSAKTVAGFAVNQGYGFGTNSWTGDQKQLIIFGTLLFFFALFLSGYFLD